MFQTGSFLDQKINSEQCNALIKFNGKSETCELGIKKVDLLPSSVNLKFAHLLAFF